MAFVMSAGQAAISNRAEADLESNRPLLAASASASASASSCNVAREDDDVLRSSLTGLWEALKKKQTQASIMTFLRVGMIVETVLSCIVYGIVVRDAPTTCRDERTDRVTLMEVAGVCVCCCRNGQPRTRNRRRGYFSKGTWSSRFRRETAL